MSDWIGLYTAIVAGNATVMGPIELFLALIIWDIRRRVIKALNPEKKKFKWPWQTT